MEPKINPLLEPLIDQESLATFSHYLYGRVNVLFSITDEIIDNIDQGIKDGIVNFDYIIRAESLIWLWILGALK